MSVTLKNPEEFIPLKLDQRIQISPDTFRFRFELPNVKHILGLPIGQNIQVRATIDDKEVIRAYTPVSSDEDFGFMDLLIKVCSNSFKSLLNLCEIQLQLLLGLF